MRNVRPTRTLTSMPRVRTLRRVAAKSTVWPGGELGEDLGRHERQVVAGPAVGARAEGAAPTAYRSPSSSRPARAWATWSSCMSALAAVAMASPSTVPRRLGVAVAVRSTGSEKRAKDTLRALYDRFGTSISGQRLIRPRDAGQGEVLLEVLMESPTHRRLPRADDELIQAAGRLNGFTGEPATFVTDDTGAAFHAQAAGLHHVRLQHKLDPQEGLPGGSWGDNISGELHVAHERPGGPNLPPVR
jgi:hypothetical protein